MQGIAPLKSYISASHAPRRASMCHTTLQTTLWSEQSEDGVYHTIDALQCVSNGDAHAYAYTYHVEV